MSTTSAAEPSAAGVHSLWRLRGYLRPHLPALVIMLSRPSVGSRSRSRSRW